MTLQITPFAPPTTAPGFRSSDVVTPLNEALGANIKLHFMEWSTSLFGDAKAIDEAQNGKGIFSGRGPMRRLAATTPKLTVAEAEQHVRESGVTGIKIQDGERLGSLDLRLQREKEKERLQGIIGRADQSLGTQALLGVTGFAVDFADPVNVATIFVPGVAEVKAGYWALKGAELVGSAVPKFAVRAGVGAIEGGLSAAVAEPITYAAHRAVGDDYDMVDSLMNIGLGAAAGGILQALGGAGIDLYRGMRLRREISADGFGRVVNDGLGQLGHQQPIDVSLRIAEEQAALAQSAGSTAEMVAPAVAARWEDSILAMPGKGRTGNRATFADLLGTKDVQQDYHPVSLPESNNPAGSSGSKIYRVADGDEIIVYIRSADVAGSPETYTVHRLAPDHPDYAGPLSERKAESLLDSTKRDGRLLYIRPPANLAKRFAKSMNARLGKLELQSGESLRQRFLRRNAGGGHTVEAEIGDVMHGTYKMYARANEDLHPGWRQNGKEPDSVARSGEYVDLKPDTPSGRSEGAEKALDYQHTLKRETAILLYAIPRRHARRIRELKKRIKKANAEKVK